MSLSTPSDVLDESQISGVMGALDRQFYPQFGCDLRKNIESLRLLAVMGKVELEAFLAQISLISLNDVEYRALHEKIESLLTQNLEAAQEQGLKI